MRILCLCLLMVLWNLVQPARSAEHGPKSADVVVYGATPGGIAAALAAADDGRTVLLVEPTPRVGGMLTSGLSHTDFRTFESLTGTFLDFTRRVQAHYARQYGPDSPQARGCFRGTHAEPSVNLAVLEAMLADRRKITVLRSHQLQRVEMALTKPGAVGLIDRIWVVPTAGGPALPVDGRVYVDGSYEGDLAAAAGVRCRVGREGRAEYNESLAPETADQQLQGYNFRLVMTTVAANRVPVPKPAGYDRTDYLGLLPLIEAGKIDRAVGQQGQKAIFKMQPPALPNGKYDINDMSHGVVRLSLPGDNQGWPTGDAATRRVIWEAHLRWNVGLLYFAANDEAVPAEFRAAAAEWGLCRDEFADTGHLPPQLYVREARRIQGLYTFTQADTAPAVGDARAVLRTDAVAIGDYGPNCHGTAHEGPRFGGRHTGEFYHPCPPYQIPYGVIVPVEVGNLLSPVAVSASHVGFCALRMEPIWTSLGQAAGHAAALARAEGLAVQAVPLDRLQARLHRAGSATIYVSDVAPGDADFAAVQWWGTAGGWHGLHPALPKPGQRGPNITGQYFQAFPGHAAELERPLSPDVETRWRGLAERLALPGWDRLPAADGHVTRGDWIRAAYVQWHKSHPH